MKKLAILKIYFSKKIENKLNRLKSYISSKVAHFDSQCLAQFSEVPNVSQKNKARPSYVNKLLVIFCPLDIFKYLWTKNDQWLQ
jgi:hypothetical protein